MTRRGLDKGKVTHLLRAIHVHPHLKVDALILREE